jgi:hypothetical protein
MSSASAANSRRNLADMSNSFPNDQDIATTSRTAVT